MVSDLQVKLEKYESKAVQCKKVAQGATSDAVREFYEGLARYYGELATDFREVIAKRTALPSAAE